MTTQPREEIRIGELTIRFLLEAKQTGSSVTVFEFDVPAGANVPAAHSHDGFEETIYGLEGILTWTLEGTPVDVEPGETLFIPRRAVHHFANTRNTNARALAIVTPGVLGPDYFREAAEVVHATAGGPPDLTAIATVMRRHGLTPAP